MGILNKHKHKHKQHESVSQGKHELGITPSERETTKSQTHTQASSQKHCIAPNIPQMCMLSLFLSLSHTHTHTHTEGHEVAFHTCRHVIGACSTLLPLLHSWATISGGQAQGLSAAGIFPVYSTRCRHNIMAGSEPDWIRPEARYALLSHELQEQDP